MTASHRFRTFDQSRTNLLGESISAFRVALSKGAPRLREKGPRSAVLLGSGRKRDRGAVDALSVMPRDRGTRSDFRRPSRVQTACARSWTGAVVACRLIVALAFGAPALWTYTSSSLSGQSDSSIAAVRIEGSARTVRLPMVRLCTLWACACGRVQNWNNR